MRYFKKFVGERVYLSPINLEDLEEYTRWFNDFEITVKMGATHHVYSLAKEREGLEKMVKEGYHLAIINLENDQLLGNCSLVGVDQINRKAELGLFIGDREYWNRGYGTEVVKLMLDYGFNILNLNNIMLRVFAFNHRAIRCYEKCGFKVMGRRRKAIIFGSTMYDEIYMDILAEEFTGKIPGQIEEQNR